MRVPWAFLERPRAGGWSRGCSHGRLLQTPRRERGGSPGLGCVLDPNSSGSSPRIQSRGSNAPHRPGRPGSGLTRRLFRHDDAASTSFSVLHPFLLRQLEESATTPTTRRTASGLCGLLGGGLIGTAHRRLVLDASANPGFDGPFTDAATAMRSFRSQPRCPPPPPQHAVSSNHSANLSHGCRSHTLENHGNERAP